MMRGRLRRKILEGLVHRDYPLVRLLFLSRFFLFAFVMVVTVLVAVPLSIVRILPSTPEDFVPEIKISVLDWIQSRTLHWTAEKARRAGDYETAIRSWRSAIANDPGRLELSRGFLELLIEGDLQRRHLPAVRQNGSWLLRLNHTNHLDLALVGRAFEFYQVEYELIPLLSTEPWSWTPELRQQKLRALMLQGRGQEFHLLWNQLPNNEREAAELQIFDVAYRSGWGSPGSVDEALSQLRVAMESESTRAMAHQLNLLVSRERLDPESYRLSLEFLESHALDRPDDHVRYWDLLRDLERTNEAIRLAMDYPVSPRTGYEIAMLAEVYVRLGLKDLAFQFLEHYADDFGSVESVWYAQAQLLRSVQRWDELYFLALRMRAQPRASEALLAFSHFVEGRAELGRGGRTSAREAFGRIGAYSMGSSQVGLHMAANLVRWSFYDTARELLLQLEGAYGDKLFFWELFFEIGQSIDSSSDMLLAAENLYRLRPNSFTALNNYAALLLSLRMRPGEAIGLTLRALNHSEGRSSGWINHAHALLLNQRPNEAARVLEAINERALSQPLRNGYHLAWLEVEWMRENLESARAYQLKIDPAYLLPGDESRFRQISELLARG